MSAQTAGSMKLSLMTDFGSPDHWRRMIEFAVAHDVARLVYWSDCNSMFKPPFLYPGYPKLLTDDYRRMTMTGQHRFRVAAEMTAAAGLEFWYVFKVLEFPDADQARKAAPELFTASGEPDMSGGAIYELIRDQLDELIGLSPHLRGIELHVSEVSTLRIVDLKSQQKSLHAVCKRIVQTVYDHLQKSGLQMIVETHTAGGDVVTLKALLAAATSRPDIIISADNVIGDFHLRLPFNEHLRRAAETNPIQVCFDLNGEYWGRNFVPTSALRQYAEHIEIARALNAVYINGRVATSHDIGESYANVLPSRQRFYPDLAYIGRSGILPHNLEICCTDTLGRFNAEFFCRRVKDPKVMPEQIVREFLVREFGEPAAELTPVFLGLEKTAGKIFYMGGNYFVTQSVRLRESLPALIATDYYLTSPLGTAFPPAAALDRPGAAVAFAGWPTPVGHTCEGAEQLIREKEEAVSEAAEMLKEAQRVAENLAPADREFLVGQFEDLLFFATYCRFLLEALAHHFLLKFGKTQGVLPDVQRLGGVVAKLESLAAEWEKRYPPCGRCDLTRNLRDWVVIIQRDNDLLKA